MRSVYDIIYKVQNLEVQHYRWISDIKHMVYILYTESLIKYFSFLKRSGHKVINLCHDVPAETMA